MLKAQFTMEDYLEQIEQMKHMGPMEDLIGMLPGGLGKQFKDAKIDPKEMTRVEAIIQSMTREERQKPDIITGSRKVRIAKGSGTQVQDVNRLLKQFSQMQKLMKMMGDAKGMRKKMRGKGGFKFPFM